MTLQHVKIFAPSNFTTRYFTKETVLCIGNLPALEKSSAENRSYNCCWANTPALLG